MEVIQNFINPDPVEELSLVYLAKPIYGGWVTFTVHLAKKYGYRLYKVGKRTEKKMRPFGYGVDYQNVCLDDLLKLPNLLITAVDKHYWHILTHLHPNTKIVIHDPTEVKRSKTTENPLIQGPTLLNLFKVYTIRETVQQYIAQEFGIQSDFKVHPFYEYSTDIPGRESHAVTISRVDFDKNTDLILRANQLIQDPSKRIQIFGAENRLYVHHKLGDLDFYTYWKGKFDKSYPILYKGKDILQKTPYVVDMSTIKHDGGGSQYTFLEAIYQDCVLILHREWVNQGTLWKEGVNCLAADTPEELASLLCESRDVTSLLRESKKLLKPHISVEW
tara:strand:+ start:180 stop:1175 length:996 start_codon:yes stop_codon:yes gene_type:complete